MIDSFTNFLNVVTSLYSIDLRFGLVIIYLDGFLILSLYRLTKDQMILSLLLYYYCSFLLLYPPRYSLFDYD